MENFIPSTCFQGSLSDDERSAHYSSSGYYESPVEDDDDGGLSKYSVNCDGFFLIHNDNYNHSPLFTY